MLASITPLGERGRRNRFAVTAVAFTAAATLAGAAVGLAAAELGRLVLPAGGGRWRFAALAVALALGLATDLGRLRLPSVRRQVNEDWLYEYRGWVYGAGFGAQLGAGVVTIVTTAAIYVMLVASALAASPALGALAVGAFGALRAAPLALAARVDTPARLVDLHARLRRWRGRAHAAGVSVDAALLAAAVAILVAPW
jgi:hypothetical protein